MAGVRRHKSASWLMDQLPDSELVAQIQTGQEEALVTLHARYAHVVYSVAYRVLNDSMAAEEVTQDTFMRLWNRSYTFDIDKGTFLTWLLTVTRHLAIDTFRKQKRDPMLGTILMDDDPELWENMLEADTGSDVRRSLVDVIRHLPEDQRHTIELAYFYGMSQSQIAEYLAVPLGTVKTRIRMGMQKLREAWNSEPAGNPKSGPVT
jgi:RNA polymerase sigma-70 factor (ECF subfamily)